jgi:iron(II)-dependent oxidoreductase
VGSFPAGDSPFGLKDMAGNVWEWTSSEYSEEYEKNRANKYRIDRGGGWYYDNPSYVRAAYRNWLLPSLRFINLGFRCAR